MKREIKFRAWCKPYEDSEGRMLELPMNILTFDYEDGYVLAFTDYPEFSSHERYDNSEPFQFEVMQYTGLKDKNGKEIYEGDLLKSTNRHHDKTQTGLVEWVDGGFCITRGETRSGYVLAAEIQWSEVVGNMYENPELLTKLS